jgi:hypothetical protein
MKGYKEFIIPVAILLFVFIILQFMPRQGSLGSAPSGLQGTLATSSIMSVATTATQLFATSTCSARIISTAGKAIMLTFSDYANQSPLSTFGHIQPASTTVAYDSGLYGCGLVKAYSFDNATQVTVSDVR